MSAPFSRPSRLIRPALVLLALTGSTALTGCQQPTPTPVATATELPTDPPTVLPPATTATALPSPTEAATATATETATLEATAPPTQPRAEAPTQAPPAPATVAPAYEVKWWADQPRMPKDLGCTAINWEVTGAREVYLRWPHQDENKVEAAGRQEGVCLNEGERAVFTLRVVLPDGSNDIREMVLERDD